MHIEHFMTKNPVACDANEPIEGAARLMRDKGVGCVVVLRNGKVAGLVTDRQIAVNAAAEGIGFDRPVEDIMTADPALLTLEDNIFSAIDTMRSAGVVRRVPVVNANRELIGIVSVSDVAVIARDLLDHILLDESHTALEETKLLTGAKRMVKEIRRPTKLDRLPGEQDIMPVTTPTPSGVGASRGAAEPPRRQKKAPPEDEVSRGPR